MIKPWLLKPQEAEAEPGSETFYPAVGADDFQWYATGFQAGNNWTGFGTHDQWYNAGFRFSNVTIPQGATITGAYMIFTAYSDTTNDPHLHILGNAADNPAAPTNQSQASGLTLTTAYADWNPADWTTDGVYDSPSMVDVVQEIVSRPGWSSGNAMMMIVQNQGAVALNHTRNACGIEYSSGTKKTALYVEWTA